MLLMFSLYKLTGNFGYFHAVCEMVSYITVICGVQRLVRHKALLKKLGKTKCTIVCK